MNLRATPSEWESSVLGVRVGLLAAEPSVSDNAVRSENSASFDVVFVSSAQWNYPGHNPPGLDHLYDMEVQVSAEKLKTSCVSAISFPGSSHVAIAREAIRDSRFLRDGRLALKSPDRYVRWLTEHRVYVPVEAPNEAFLVASDDPDGARRISLVAVSEQCRSKGIGARLVAGVFAAEPTKSIWRVKVSAGNHRAIRFYETLGFRVKAVSTIFHVWTHHD